MTRYQDRVAKLESKGMFPNRPASLEPTRQAMVELGLLEQVDPSCVILVAGTNGKGSTCATLEALLRAAGQKTGLFTSPHLMKLTERIRISGGDMTEQEFCDYYDELEDVFHRYGLSHFEATTVMALKNFIDRNVDWMIFEVGVGGLWDATNAIPHDYCIITPLDFDHMHLLGNTIEQIAKNKFGIVHKNAKVAHAPLPKDVLQLQRRVETDTSSTWIARHKFGCGVDNDKSLNPRFFIDYNGRRAELALPGQRGAENAALALTAFQMLGYEPNDYLHALKNVNWPGRMERLDPAGWACPVFLSGDHNMQGVRSLLELLTHYTWNTLHMIVGIGQNKDVQEMLSALSKIPNSRLYLTETTFKARALNEYDDWLHKAAHVEKEADVMLNYVKRWAKPGDMVLVTGSLYLVGDMRAVLLNY